MQDDTEHYPDGVMSKAFARKDVVDLVVHEDPTHRCVGRLHASGIPTLLDKWVAGELARPGMNGSYVAAALISLVGGNLGALILTLLPPDRQMVQADEEGRMLAHLIRATIADHEGVSARAMKREDAVAQGEEAVAEARARLQPEPQRFGTVELNIRSPEGAISEMLDRGDAQSSAAARLVATGAHGKVMEWVQSEIRHHSTRVPDLYAAAMTLSTTPLGFLASFAPAGPDREELIATLSRSFRDALELLAVKNEDTRRREARGA